ncbi:MAG: tRNA-dihydrouridine synthase family protein [Lachnospiraceae bacterium]|nr:tRNA-dihydrouridine synthase family protein [Lachnospiraceae bacterium]
MAGWYLAPMEEVTGDLFRVAIAKHFGGVDRYFTPFLSPVTGVAFKTRQGREIDPSHNAGLPVVPQVLTDNADAALHMFGVLADLGYSEVNLNFGCPSGTVVKKGRGSGFLRDVDGMKRFFDRIFSAELPVTVSVKTRIGFADAAEWPAILAVYNQYPLSELIVHARVREDWYGNRPNTEAIAYALAEAKAPLVYNGDVTSAAGARELMRRYPGLSGVMIGRGAVTNPGIFRELQGGEAMTAAELRAFHDDLYGMYCARYGAKDTLFKMKELWGYLGDRYPDAPRAKKQIHKCRTEAEYLAAASELLGEA